VRVGARDDLPVAVDQEIGAEHGIHERGGSAVRGRRRAETGQRWAERAAQVVHAFEHDHVGPRPRRQKVAIEARERARTGAVGQHAVAADAVIHDAPVRAAARAFRRSARRSGQRRFAPAVEPTPSLIESPSTNDGFRACGLQLRRPTGTRRACSFCAGFEHTGREIAGRGDVGFLQTDLVARALAPCRPGSTGSRKATRDRRRAGRRGRSTSGAPAGIVALPLPPNVTACSVPFTSAPVHRRARRARAPMRSGCVPYSFVRRSRTPIAACAQAHDLADGLVREARCRREAP